MAPLAAPPRPPWWRVAVAAGLALAILGLTYALFDPDLGTPVPLLQEVTCLPHGRLALEVENPTFGAVLRMPDAGLVLEARGEGELRPAYFLVHRRDAPELEWTQSMVLEVPEGRQAIVIGAVLPTTQVYVEAKDLDGRFCAARSGVLTAQLSSATGSP